MFRKFLFVGSICLVVAEGDTCPFKACQDDSDCADSTTCSWCSSPKPGKNNNQTCTGPPSPDDCNVIPGPAEDASKPQYACWGDSVSKGIFSKMKKLLTGWETFHPSSSVGGGCGNVIRGKYCTEFWLNGAGGAAAPARKWDLITFNFGLHDLAQDSEHVSIERYQRNLRNISTVLLDAMEEQHGRLFWLSSTPVPNMTLAPPRSQDDVPTYNAAAKEVMDALNIPIIDVYAFVIEQCGDEHYTSCPGFQKDGNVHFEGAGYTKMAEFIYNSIQNSTLLV